LQQIKTERENFQLAKALLDLTLQRYQLIAATIVEVREAQRSFTEAGYRLVNLSYAAKIAEVELKRLASQLAY
jgi:outer membrane protein TolC